MSEHQSRMYSGAVLNGPLKGKWVTHDKAFYRVAPAPSPLRSFATAAADFTIEYITYVWTDGGWECGR